MYNNISILAIIPARGGSKGVPRKNIRDLAGKPLIAWTIESAKQSKYIDKIILSSEDSEIIQVARQYGCEVPFVRPEHLAVDETTSAEVILHALDMLPHYDLVVMLQPTSPLRLAEDIDKCIEKLILEKATACVSVSESSQSPYWMYTFDKSEKLHPIMKHDSIIPRRQELPSVYALNGAVYVAYTSWFKQSQSFLTNETIGFVMPENRSYDIDKEIDFLLCDWFISKK